MYVAKDITVQRQMRKLCVAKKMFPANKYSAQPTQPHQHPQPQVLKIVKPWPDIAEIHQLHLQLLKHVLLADIVKDWATYVPQHRHVLQAIVVLEAIHKTK